MRFADPMLILLTTPLRVADFNGRLVKPCRQPVARPRRLIKRASLGRFREPAESEAQEFVERVRSDEAQEAFSAFLEKRPPDFNHTPTRHAAE